MARYLAKRLGLSLVTLCLLSVLVFVGGQVLPGDIGRAMLGPLADERAVDALRHELGVDRPLLVQYGEWIFNFIQGDMGTSYIFRAPVWPFIRDALANSLKLAAVAFVMVVPVAVLAGVIAALNANRPLDRFISIFGLSATVLPEFVSGIVLILVFSIWLRWLPLSATWPDGAGPLTQVYYLHPAVAAAVPGPVRLYRAHGAGRHDRGARCRLYAHGGAQGPRAGPRSCGGTSCATRCCRPSRVIATQTGYLIGGLVVVETLFRYQGIGALIFSAARAKDFPMLQAGVLTIGIVYTVATLAADLLYTVLNPRIRLGAAG